MHRCSLKCDLSTGETSGPQRAYRNALRRDNEVVESFLASSYRLQPGSEPHLIRAHPTEVLPHHGVLLAQGSEYARVFTESPHLQPHGTSDVVETASTVGLDLHRYPQRLSQLPGDSRHRTPTQFSTRASMISASGQRPLPTDFAPLLPPLLNSHNTAWNQTHQYSTEDMHPAVTFNPRHPVSASDSGDNDPAIRLLNRQGKGAVTHYNRCTSRLLMPGFICSFPRVIARS